MILFPVGIPLGAGVLVLALRGDDGTFTTNPDPEMVLHPNHVIIAVGTTDALQQLVKVSR